MDNAPPPAALPQFKRLTDESLKRLREEYHQLVAEKKLQKAEKAAQSDKVSTSGIGEKKRGPKKSFFEMFGKEAFPRKRPAPQPLMHGSVEPLDSLEKVIGHQPTLPGDEETADIDEEEEDDKGQNVKPKPNWALVAGKKLPPALDDYFDKKLYAGVPLEEIDEYYKGQEVRKHTRVYTFLILINSFTPYVFILQMYLTTCCQLS